MSNINHSRLSNLLFRQVRLHRTRLVHQFTRIQHNHPQQSPRAATTCRKHRQGLTVSAAGARALGPLPAPPPGAGTANLYYQCYSQPAPRGYGTPPPGAYPPPAPYHTHPQGTLSAPNYPAPHAPGGYSGQSTMASSSSTTANTNSNSGGPGLRLPPLQAREDHGERARTELKDDRPGGMLMKRAWTRTKWWWCS